MELTIKPFSEAIENAAGDRNDRASLPRNLMYFDESIKVCIGIFDRICVLLEVGEVARGDHLVVVR